MKKIKDVNEEASQLIQAINKFIDASSMIDYKFSEKEQMMLQNRIRVLNNQIDILINWELKNQNKS